MTDRGATYRAGELDTPIIFRSNRFYTRGSDWYFSTREGLDQGPFSSRILAHEAIQNYIRERQFPAKLVYRYSA